VIQPSDQMVQLAVDKFLDSPAATIGEIDGAMRDALAEVLALIERDYRLIPRAAARRRSPVDHDPEALRWARERAGWRQGHLATAVGISRSLMSEAEKGTRGLSPAVLAKVAVVLGCPVTALERKGGGT
jgi:DNA-binding XRE family transcriptional regulator